MAEGKGQHYLVFKSILVLGGVLGFLLLFQTIRNYRYVSDRLVEDALFRESVRHTNDILERFRQEGVLLSEDLTPLLDKIREEQKSEIAWLRVMNLHGKVLAACGESHANSFPKEAVRGLFQPGSRVSKKDVKTPGGLVFVALQPFRLGFATRGPGQNGGAGSSGPPPMGNSGTNRPLSGGRRGGGPLVMEIALYQSSLDPLFGIIRRNMIINISAALALLVALGFIGLRFRHYIHGRQIQQQLEVARNVQQDLLPKEWTSQANLEVAAICEPAWQVGGDFYDVFHAADDCVMVTLGDVSGKGLPAALLMGMLHGAIRSSGIVAAQSGLEDATRRLNELLYARTAIERFVTMFWCYYDPRSQVLRYVNAGHLPPFVVRRDGDGGVELLRLEAGGPVLGIIPSAPYQQGSVPFEAGDLLVVYSDGVAEAADKNDEEFGEERLAAILREHASDTATGVRDEILRRVKLFIQQEPLQDDLTLLVVRAGTHPVRTTETAAAEVETA